MPMRLNQKDLDTLVAPTYTCVVSSHSHNHSPRQYLDETVETKRAAHCLSALRKRHSGGCYCLQKLLSYGGSASTRPNPQKLALNVWRYKCEVKGKEVDRRCPVREKGEGRA